jgi:hypothetical protein
MSTTPSPQGQCDTPPQDERRTPSVQTGALPGGQPGHGVNTSSSEPGQSNVDAAARQGTEYGRRDDRRG